MSETANYGTRYFCVKVPFEISGDGEIYLYADRVELRDGALIFWGKYYPSEFRDGRAYVDYDKKDGDEMALLILNKECWKAYYAASCLDGAAVAVEHWRGEVCSQGGAK
jgi:hypothetical protein